MSKNQTKLSYEHLIGLPLEEAKQRAKKMGVIIRANHTNSEGFLFTCDYKQNRITVSVDDGIVDSILSVG